MESFSLYEITDYELELIERGSPAELFLNFAIFLISTAVSLTVTLTTTNITSNRIFAVYTIVAVVGFVLGLILLALWFRTRKSLKKLCSTIKNRIKASESSVPSANALDGTPNS